MPTERFSPEDVLEFTEPTNGFLCPIAANVYDIEFVHFEIRDYESKRKIFEVGVDCPVRKGVSLDLSKPLNENSYRKIRYEFSEDVLRLPSIMTSLRFSVGKSEVPNFRMIERHYFRDELVKSYDFSFGFCIPSSTNSWDAIYSMPPLEDNLISDMVAAPYATKSDSFYFVGDELIMHNKAEYKYIKEDLAQEKRSYYDDYDNKALSAKAAASSDAKAAEKKSEAKDGATAKYQEKWSKEDDYSN